MNSPNALESLASQLINGTQGRIQPPHPLAAAMAQRKPPTDEEKRDAAELIRDGNVCRFCAGIHVGFSGPACPRLASGKLSNGEVVEFTFWPDGQWDTSRVVFVADLGETADPDETRESS